MAKRKGKETGLLGMMFDEVNPYERGVELAPPQTLPLSAILPDRDQPRQLLPLDLADAVTAGQLRPTAALRQWLARASASGGGGTATIAALRELADSIARHGLINPITVRPVSEASPPFGVKYWIVTGERRYWAHVLLNLEERLIQEGDRTVEPAAIKAQVAPAGASIRAHQLVENLMRADINAIEKAHGLWALRYELSGVTYRSPRADEVTDRSPQPEADVDLVPWRRVSEFLGISKRHRIRLTAVLNLPPAGQRLVAEHNLAEMTIRPIVQKLKDKPALQIEALEQLVAWQSAENNDDAPGRRIVASVRELVDTLLARDARPSAETTTTAPAHSAPLLTYHRRLNSAIRYFNRLTTEQRAALARDLARSDDAPGQKLALRRLRDQLNALLQELERAREQP